MTKQYINLARARLSAMLGDPTTGLYQLHTRFPKNDEKVDPQLLADLRKFAYESTDIEIAVFISYLLEKIPKFKKKDISTILNRNNQYVSRILAMLDPQWRAVISSGVIPFASLLEQYRPLPAKQKTELRKLAKTEKRSLTSGDIRAAKIRAQAESSINGQVTAVFGGTCAVEKHDQIPASQVDRSLLDQAAMSVKNTRSSDNWNSRLAKARIEKGIPTVELAMGAGVSPETITGWENGSIKTIGAEHCLKLSIYLDKSPYWIMFGIADGRKYIKRNS